MENMYIYNQGRSVPDEAKKAFNNGSFSGTDINPMWRIKKLTELFGPCGIGWYYDVLSERAEEHHDMTMAIVNLNLYVKFNGEWSKPIYGTGGNALVKVTKSGQKASDEGYKMALTDALSVACKALGIGADVYFEKDKTKYTQYATEAEPKTAPESEIARGSVEAAQQAGKDKLKELERKAAEAAQQPAKGPVMATAKQLEYIKQHADDETKVKAMTAFGFDLENMTSAQANKLIDRIKKTNDEYLTAASYGNYPDDAGAQA